MFASGETPMNSSPTLSSNRSVSSKICLIALQIAGFAVACLLTGCGAGIQGVQAGANATDVVLSATSSSVRLGATSVLSANINGVSDKAGTWGVLGGTSNGVIDATGLYHAPSHLPSPNDINVIYTRGESSQTIELHLLNPVPSIVSSTPATVVAASTLMTITGSGFVPSSLVLVNGSPIMTTYVDSQHITGTLQLDTAANITLPVSVSNPDPGASTSDHIEVATDFQRFQITPSRLDGGDVSITWTGPGIPADALVSLDGKLLTTTSISPSSITAAGFLPPWKAGSSMLQLVSSTNAVVLAAQNVPINNTKASFDQAARFATQAAFGPRPDVVTHIQKVGLEAFIDEQFSLPPVNYDPTQDAATQFNQLATSGPSLLRLRLAWALQNFITAKRIDAEFSFIPFEQMLERDCSGNFRQLLSDVSADPSVAFLLNLGGNVAPTDPKQSPNQNFARELMQLYTLGPTLLNDDGTVQLDGSGQAIPTYSQSEVVDLSRVFTGWNYPPPVNPPFISFYRIDVSLPLVGNDSQHDQGSKTIVGGTRIPAGLGIAEDRRRALDAIFLHPNVPPFISHLLIQHLVKSAPSPSYVSRISRVFENDGTGTRGNLSAVVRAILLDPEARSGDITASADDGFLQEPLLFQMFAVSLTETPLSDAQTNYWGQTLSQAWWGGPPSVFGYYRPDNVVPGTNVISPEFQILTNQNIIVRSQYLWGIVTGTAPGLSTNPHPWLFTKFTALPDFVDALDHLAYHGTMPAYEKAAILTYCNGLGPNNRDLQFRSALFLALNSDHYTVSR